MELQDGYRIIAFSLSFGVPTYLLILLLKDRLKEVINSLSRGQLIFLWVCGLLPQMHFLQKYTFPFFWASVFNSQYTTMFLELLLPIGLLLSLLCLIPLTWQWMEAQKDKE